MLYPCSCCKKSVKSNQKALLCTICNNWVHTSCAGISNALYNDPSQHFVEWQCRKCIFELLPFKETDVYVDNLKLLNDSKTTKKGESVNEFSSVRKFEQLSDKGLKFCHLNIASLLKNIDEVRLFMKENNVDVLALNETRLDDSVNESEISVPMYNIVRKDRDRMGGGVAIYVKAGINFQIVDHVAMSQLEALCIKICPPKSKPIFFVNWYRPPNAKIEKIDLYENLLQFLDSFNAAIIVMGDVNCDIMDKQHSSLCVKYNNINNVYSMEHVNTCQPTRTTHNTETLIDHMLTNNGNNVKSFGVIHLGMSDHSMSYLIWKGNNSKSEPRYVEYRNMKKINKESFKQNLMDQPWHAIEHYTNLNEAVHRWEELLMQVVNKHMPIRRKRVKQQSCPWMNANIHKLMKKRDKLKKRACKEKDNNLMKQYRSLRNKVTGEIKKAKRKYYTDKLTTEKNNTQVWKTLKSLLPNKKPSNSVFQQENEQLANNFNSFFSKVGKNLSESIPRKELNKRFPKSKLIEADFEFTAVSEKQILTELKRLKNKKSTGLDGISAVILKLASKEITPALTYIINRSIAERVFPSRWKVAKVIPLFKKGDKSLPDNYRPISLLPVVSKVLERVIHIQLSNHLKKYALLAQEQSGFRPLHSTQTTLVRVTDDWLNAMGRQCYTGVVFVDLRKAFDTVDHDVLLYKLESIGVGSSCIEWFKDYLRGRKIVTQINDSLSQEEDITHGVPQGSILGPLLFVIYINDMIEKVNNCKMHLYADDTVLYFSDANPLKVQRSLQEDLSRMYGWMCDNRLSLNCDKTVCMLIGNRKMLNKHNVLELNVNTRKLEQVPHTKYLGITVDEELNWNLQVDNVCKRVSKMISFMRRLRGIIDKEHVKLVYNSLILPQLEYADIVWDSGKKETRRYDSKTSK